MGKMFCLIQKYKKSLNIEVSATKKKMNCTHVPPQDGSVTNFGLKSDTVWNIFSRK